jgi:ribulose-phosphate 3-epimerase
MSVNPGFGGQKLIPAVLDKVRRLRERIDRERLPTRIEIDGGVDLDNLESVAASGVDVIVSGSAVFESKDVRGTTERMVRFLAARAEHGQTH